MLRCPFNNFSKCDGNCPFSTENFAACKLASLLISIEGLCRGQLAQASTTNAHLVEAKELLEEMATAPDAPATAPELPVQRKHPKKKNRCCVYRNIGTDRTEIRLAVVGDAAAHLRAICGDGRRTDVFFIPSERTFLLTPGTSERSAKLTTNEASGRTMLSIGMWRSAVEHSIGIHHYAILEPTISDGMLRLVATGEVED